MCVHLWTRQEQVQRDPALTEHADRGTDGIFDTNNLKQETAKQEDDVITEPEMTVEDADADAVEPELVGLASQVLQARAVLPRLFLWVLDWRRRRGLPTLPQELWRWGRADPGGRPSTGPPPEQTEGW